MTWDDERDLEIERQERDEERALEATAEYLIGTTEPPSGNGRHSLRAAIRQAIDKRDAAYREAASLLSRYSKVEDPNQVPEVRDAWRWWGEADARLKDLVARV